MAGENEYNYFINGLSQGCDVVTEEESACETVSLEVPACAIDEKGNIDFSKI